MRPTAQQSIEASLTARVEAVEAAGQTPEQENQHLRVEIRSLRSRCECTDDELVECRDEIARLRSACDGYRSEMAAALDGTDRVADALDLATDRLTQWVADGGMVHVDLLAELLADMDEVVA